MNKINYILDLTNITLQKDAKSKAVECIRAAEERTEKKKGRKTALIAVISAVVFAALVICISLIVKEASRPGPVTDTVTAETYVETTEPYTETTAVKDPYPEIDGYYYFRSFYSNDPYYDVFRDTIKLMKPYADSVVAADDLSPLYKYFGEAKPSAEELCETLFAFYEPGCVRNIRSISAYSDDELLDIKSDIQTAVDGMNGFYHNGFIPEDIILLTAKNGTFEYLLTLSVNRDGLGTSALYDAYGSRIGSAGVFGAVNGYKISKSFISRAKAYIYKIRFESGLPVIYDVTEIKEGGLVMPDVYKEISMSGQGLITAAELNGDETVDSARFKIHGGIVEFNNDENFMTDPVFGQNSIVQSPVPEMNSASLCDYPYCIQQYDKNSVLCGKRTVCEIINEFHLQWFFPMYVTETPEGTLIIGEGIKTGEEVSDYFDLAASVPSRLYGAAYENNIYTTYRGSPVGLCYLSDTCDRPYFDKSFFNTTHSYMAITVKKGSVVSVETVYSNELKERLPGFVSPTKLDVKFTSSLPYIKDPSDTFYPTRPFDKKYLPLLCEDITEQPALFTELDLVLPEYMHINSYLSDLCLGYREISVTDSEEEIILYAGDMFSSSLKYMPDGNKYFKITAFEEIRGYIIDMSGCVCGIRTSGTVYIFTTVQPQFTLSLRSQNGCVTFSGVGSGSETDNAIFGNASEFGDWFGSVIDPGTALHLLYKLGEPAPALEMYEDPDSHSYITGIDVANMPNGRVYGIKNGDARTYTYYSNLVKVFENGKTYWMCPSNTHIHGFYRYFISYDGNELSITHSEGPYYAE